MGPFLPQRVSDRIQFDSHAALWALPKPSGQWVAGGIFRCESGAPACKIDVQVDGLTPQHHKNQGNPNAFLRSLRMACDSDLKIKLRRVHPEDDG